MKIRLRWKRVGFGAYDLDAGVTVAAREAEVVPAPNDATSASHRIFKAVL